MKTYSLFSTLAILILIFILWDSNQNHKAELNNETKAKEFHKAESDSILALYNEVLEQDTAKAILYANAIHRAENAEKRYLKSEQELRQERRLNRKFKDVELDSLLSLVR